MAYKVKYRLDYCNKEKLNARLDFEIKDYSSTTIHNIVGTQDAFSYKVRNEKPDRSGYFRTLEADINIFEDENFNIDNLLTSDETKIRVKFYIEGQIEFVGFIIPDFFEVSIDKPRVISMVASDRIGTLKNQTLPRQTGVQSFRYMIEQSLLKTGLDLPINSTINFNPIGETGDFLTKTGGLMERLSSDKGASISCYDIIKSILIVSNAILVQSGGQWHILNKLEYESRPKTKDIEQINVGGRRLINPPSSKVGVMAEFGGSKAYPLNNNFLIRDANNQIANWYAYRDFQSYSADGGGLLVVSPRYTTLGEFNYGEAEPIQIESANPKKVEITAGANVTLHLSESLQVMNTAFSLEATNGTDSLYLTEDGTFSDRFELIYQYGEWDADLDSDVTRSPSYTATLEAENVNDWHLIYRIYGNETPSPLGLTSATWNFVNVEVRGFPSDAKGILYKIEQGVNFTNEVELDTTIFGDFITNGVNGYFYDYAKDERNSIYYKINNEWKHKGIKWRSFNNSSPDTLLLHSVRQRAIMFSAPHNIITATIKGKFSALDIYDVCGIKYVLVEAQYNFYRNETELRIEEIKYDNSVLKTDYVYSYFGGEDTTSISGVSGVSSGGSSGGGGAPCLIKIDDDGNYYVEENFYSLKDVSAFGKDELGGGGGDGVALTSWIDQITTLTDFNQNTNFIKQSEVVDNLTSNLSNLPLSARQGMILKNFIDNIEVGEGGQVVVDWDSILGKPTEFNPTAHTHVISDVTGLQVALDAKTSKTYVDDGLDTKENAFVKNTAFNRNFGTTAGTVATGNHTHTFASLTSKPTTLGGYGITDGAKSVDVDAHITDKENPHEVDKYQIELGNVINVKQATKTEFDTFKNLFDSLFELDGDYIKAKKSLYSTGDLSAFGKDNLGGGGSSGGTDLVSWQDQIMTLTDFNVGSNFINIQQVEAKGYATVIQLNDRVKTPVPLNAKFTDTIVDISGKVDKVAGKSLISDSEIARLSNVTNQDLTPYATNSRVNAIDNRLVTVEANYTTQSDIDTAIDGIEIGGRNLITGSFNDWRSRTVSQYGYSSVFIPIQDDWRGKTVTHSFEVKDIPEGESVRIRLDYYRPDTTYITPHYGNIVSLAGKSFVTYIVPTDTQYDRIRARIMPVNYTSDFTVLFRCEKLEFGTKATDWTPAPEDQIADWNQTNVNAFDFIKNKPTKLSQFSNVETDFVNKTYVDNTFATIGNFNSHTSNTDLHKTQSDRDAIASFLSMFELDGDFIKAKKSLYSVGDLSAFGKDNLGGGTGGGTDLVSWVDQITTLTDFNQSTNFINIQQVEAKDYATNTRVDGINSRLTSVEGGSVTTVTTSGSGNAITSISKSGTVITAIKGDTFSKVGHTHSISDITNLQTELNSKASNTTVNGISSRLTTVESNYTTQSDIDTAIGGIEIGGRNLITGSFNDWRSRTVSQYGYSSVFIPIQDDWRGKTVTHSFEVKDIPEGESVRIRLDYYRPDTTYITPHYGNIVSLAGKSFVTYIVPTDTQYDRIRARIMPVNYTSDFTVLFRCEKLEFGTKATDWTPAPEDQIADWNQTNVNAFDFIKNKPTKLSQFSNVETDFVNKTYVDNTFATIGNFNSHTSNTDLHKTQSDRDAIASFLSMFELDGDFIKAKKSLYSVGDLSAFGKDNLGGGTGGGTDLVSWVDQITTLTDFNQSTNFINIQQVEAKDYATNTRVDGINSRLTSVEGGSVTTVTTSGSGNAITSISKSGTVITAIKGDTFSKVGHTHSISDITNLQTELNSKASNTTVNGISSRLTTVESNYTTQSDIDTAIGGIEIGGRNYALQSGGIKNSSVTLYIPDSLKGQKVTLSFRLKLVNAVGGAQNRVGFEGSNRNNLGVLKYYGAWHTLSGTPQNFNGIVKSSFTIGSDFTGNSLTLGNYRRFAVGDVVELSDVKLEKGNKATDWSPAPEDQVSDWNSTNSNAFDFIKNKPTKLSQFSNVETDFTSKTYVTTELNKKVDKVTGKSLISDSEISRLSTVVNQTATSIGLGNVTNESKSTMFNNPTFTGTVSGVTKSMVGLSNVDNVKQATKSEFDNFVALRNNPHEVTKKQVGLEFVTNESKSTMFTDPTFTGTTKVTILELNTNWKFVKVGNNIELQYNGVTKQEMTAAGHIIAHGDVTALLDN